ncbi:hypothetical protein [Streptomyces hyaluromycini]|uniref:hypothetical protein n=1 Tax=Streptomyces hyaluromycini TaxID=1377993 RepID=UPI000B5C49A3|nr:hypothetical protein [Streptomyces hyaluromycini]
MRHESIDPRLALSAGGCGALEESAAEWFARGASEAQLVQAMSAGLPEHVAHAYGFVRARLDVKLPPEPEPQPPTRYEVVCTACTACTACAEPAAGASLRGGLCEGCRGGRSGLTADQVHAHVGRLRAALRTRPRTRKGADA